MLYYVKAKAVGFPARGKGVCVEWFVVHCLWDFAELTVSAGILGGGVNNVFIKFDPSGYWIALLRIITTVK